MVRFLLSKFAEVAERVRAGLIMLPEVLPKIIIDKATAVPKISAMKAVVGTPCKFSGNKEARITEAGPAKTKM